MSDGVTLSKFAEYASEASGEGATFFSEVFNEISKGAIPESQRLTKAADALKQDFQRFSETAAKYAEKAAQSGNNRAAEVFSKISDAHAEVAAARAISSDAAYVAAAAQSATSNKTRDRPRFK
ncbi:MAG: hypothetical protein ACLGHA_10535 [Gammaproteobacteria bacterium]